MNAATSRSRRDDIILSENAKEYQRKKLIAFDYFRKIYGNPDLLPDTVKAYENVFKLDVPEKILSSLYVNYADLLASNEKAIEKTTRKLPKGKS